MDNKKKIILPIVIMMIAVILVGTYAWLTYRTNDTAMVLTIGDIQRTQVTLSPYQIKGTLDEVTTYTSGKLTEVEATNNSSSTSNFTLYYQINSIDSSLATNSLKYKVMRSTNGSTYSDYKNGTFNGTQAGSNLTIMSEELPAGPNLTYNYKVYLYLNSGSSGASGTFDGELRAVVDENAIMPANIPTFITQNAVMDNTTSTYVTNSSGIQFNAASSDTNGKGVYIRATTASDINPIYYYRGAVTDNNVYFAGFCWKIVRTTETGGIKLIYNGTAVSGQCSNTTGTGTRISTSSFNANYTSPADVGYMYGTRYASTPKEMTSISDSYLYGGGYSYSSGTYTLTNTISFAGTDWASNYNTLNNNHYTCFNTTGTCSSLYYIYYTSSSSAYYITLTNNKSVSAALDEMLSSSSNANSSTIKTTLDTWYESNLSSYETYLEDTIWCNDREIYQLNGWDPNGGDTTKDLYFAPYQRTYSTYTPIVACTNKNDAFTVTESSSGNGALSHPIGLLTVDEFAMAGRGGTSHYLYTNQSYWLASPRYFGNGSANGFHVTPSGSISYRIVLYTPGGVRPSVSLKPGTVFEYGDGTVASPYRFVSTVS